jgi:hypothetical protein
LAAGPASASLRHPPRHEGGFVLVWLALMITALLGIAGLAVDVANWYFQANRQQKAADAAALAGAVFLPADTTQAYSTAGSLADKNGYKNGVSATTVTAQQESKPTRLRVTITRTVNNFFGGLLGVGNTTISRTSVAEFAGPVPMGSPSNVFGNEPPADGQWSSVTGNSSFWVNVAGAQTTKVSGDQHQAAACASGVDGCSSGTNVDYFSLSGAPDPQYQGYFYNVRVMNPPPGQKLAIEVFDPAFVQVGDTCTSSFLNSATAIDPVRYATGPNSPYCTGDHKINATCNPPDQSCLPVTTFTFRAPDNTPWSLTDNPVISTGSCATRTYQPFQGDLGPKINGDPTFASYFRKWARVCEIPATDVQTYLTSVGGIYEDFLIQLRTNASTNNQSAPGAGHNRLSIRGALIDSGGSINGSAVSINASQTMALYANATGADTRFFLARVLPGADGQVLNLQFFDIGDASVVSCGSPPCSATGVLTVLPPAEYASSFSNCTYTPPGSSTYSSMPGCSVTSTSAFNGKLIKVRIPLPTGYTCNTSSVTGCWVKIRYTFPASVQAADTTTWSASIEGDPVRLVE